MPSRKDRSRGRLGSRSNRQRAVSVYERLVARSVPRISAMKGDRPVVDPAHGRLARVGARDGLRPIGAPTSSFGAKRASGGGSPNEP
jgi:hypothetical protein